jgi:hypothetical protein
VGKNFHGSKLLAVWPSGEASQSLFDAHNYRLFVPPLSLSEAEALHSAARVALVRAGDLFVFSGGTLARVRVRARARARARARVRVVRAVNLFSFSSGGAAPWKAHLPAPWLVPSVHVHARVQYACTCTCTCTCTCALSSPSRGRGAPYPLGRPPRSPHAPLGRALRL